MSKAFKFTYFILNLLYISVLSYGLYEMWHYQRTEGVLPINSNLCTIIYVVWGGIIALLLGSFFLKKAAKVNLSLILVSVLITVYLINLFSLFYYAKTSKYVTGTSFPVVYPKIKELLDQGVAVYSTVDFDLFFNNVKMNSLPNTKGVKFSPLGNASNVTIVTCKESEDYFIIDTDEYGFNNPRGGQTKTTEILFLGDSFTEGQCVRNENGFVSHIRQRLPAIVNLSRGGSGPLFQYATFREYGIALKPKLVIWAFYEGNDLDDFKSEKDSYLNQYQVDDNFSLNLREKQKEIDELLKSLSRNNMELYLREQGIPDQLSKDKDEFILDLLRLGFLFKSLHYRQATALDYLKYRLYYMEENFNSTYRKGDFYELAKIRKLYEKTQSKLNDWGGKLLLVYIPSANRYVKDNDYKLQVFDLYHKDFISAVSTAGLPIIDLTETFSQQSEPLSNWALLYGKFYGHLNSAGHQLVADRIMQVLGLNP